jgi:predicted dehydrogenase
MSIRLKEYLEGKKPLIATYRVNAGYLPKEHWANDPLVGGGRIIGEACHFFDYFNWLIGSSPQSIHAVKIGSGSVYDSDNILCTINYVDGSIAELNYNTIGGSAVGKEYLEVFQEGKTMLLDDYVKLNLDGKVTTGQQDKGHYNELLEFAKKVRGENSVLADVNDSLSATLLSFSALESAGKRKVLDIRF